MIRHKFKTHSTETLSITLQPYHAITQQPENSPATLKFPMQPCSIAGRE